MPKFSVEMHITNKKTVSVWAKDAEDALQRAENLVMGWPNVEDCEAVSAEVEDAV